MQAQDNKRLATLTLAALGVVYGDIGTSPLYSLKECFNGPHSVPPTPENVLGVLSLVFWALTFVMFIAVYQNVKNVEREKEFPYSEFKAKVKAGQVVAEFDTALRCGLALLVLVGVLLDTVVALPLGIAMGAFSRVRALFGPLQSPLSICRPCT